MTKSRLTNNDLAELLDYYLLTQKTELPPKFDNFIIPEGREALVKLVQARLRCTCNDSPAEKAALGLGQLRQGWDKLKAQVLPAFNFVPGKYATLELNKLPTNMMLREWELARQWLLECIWILIDTEMSNSRKKWPEGLAKPEVLFDDMLHQLSVEVLRKAVEAERPVLVIGMPEHIDRNDKLVDIEVINTLKRTQVELQGTYSGWTIQTVSEARFHE